MSRRKTIARNAAVMMGSQAITWGLTLLLTIFLPRYLGAAAVGKFHFANSLWAVVAIMAAFGMDTLLTKEIARNRERLAGLVWNSMLLRLGLFVLGWGGVLIFLQSFGYPADTRQVVFVLGFSSLLWLLAGATQSALQGLERMEYNSLGMILSKVVYTLVSIGLLLAGQGVLVIAGVSVLAAAVNLLVQSTALRRLSPIPIRIDWSEMRRLLKAGVPYLLSGIFLVIYMQFDIVILSLLINDQAVGWYGAADQLFGTLLFIPTVLMTAVFPSLSRLFVSDSEALLKITRKSLDLHMLFSVPIGLGVLVVANQAVVLLFGSDFAPSGPILALMGIVLILTYLNVFLGQTLISMDRQNQWTAVMAAATVATLPLDLWLIPWCQAAFNNGGIGGALSFIITEGVMVLAGLAILPRGTLNRANWLYAGRAILAGLVMTGATWGLRENFIVLPIAVGGLVYLLMAWVLRLAAPEDVHLVKEMSRNALNQLRSKLGA